VTSENATKSAIALATTLGINICDLSGSGHNGKVTLADVKATQPKRSRGRPRKVDIHGVNTSQCTNAAKELITLLKLDMSKITGTGHNGKIIMKDVHHYLECKRV
jgi:pyruvate/2-oxoglutarate dehydrogenase complex dihydrolipoamide acyltransferase (E2) component